MKESDLYIPVRDWLIARGYDVHVEIFDADIVAVKDGELTVVELKLCLSNDLYCQCNRRSWWADYVYAAVASTPKWLDGYRQAGFGVLLVSGGRVRQKAKAKPQPWMWHKRHDYRMKRLSGRRPAMPHELAGLKSGEALRMQRLLRDAGD